MPTLCRNPYRTAQTATAVNQTQCHDKAKGNTERRREEEDGAEGGSKVQTTSAPRGAPRNHRRAAVRNESVTNYAPRLGNKPTLWLPRTRCTAVHRRIGWYTARRRERFWNVLKSTACRGGGERGKRGALHPRRLPNGNLPPTLRPLLTEGAEGSPGMAGWASAGRHPRGASREEPDARDSDPLIPGSGSGDPLSTRSSRGPSAAPRRSYT